MICRNLRQRAMEMKSENKLLSRKITDIPFYSKISTKLPMKLPSFKVIVDTLKAEDIPTLKPLLLSSLSAREPVTMSVNGYYTGLLSYYDMVMKKSVDEGIGVTMKSLEGELAMVLICFGTGEEIRNSVNPLHLAPMGYPAAGILGHFFDTSFGVMREYCTQNNIEPERVMDMALGTSSIPPSLSGQKLPKLGFLLSVAMSLAQEKHGITHVASILKNSFSARQVADMGMQTIARFPYNEFEYFGPGVDKPIRPFEHVNQIMTNLKNQDGKGVKKYVDVAKEFVIGIGLIDELIRKAPIYDI